MAAGAARVGSIFIGMRVGMGGLSSGLSQASSQLQAFAGYATSNIKAGLGALGVTATVKGLLDLRDAASATMDTTAKLADRIGASTEGLVGLQHGAKLAGIEGGALDTALTKLGVNLARAAAGGKETEGAFARLGLNAKQLASMDRVEAFKAIADAISKIPNPAEQAALSVELFGKAGADLGVLLNQGAKGIAAAEAEAKRLGLTFSRADAAQVEAANDAWTKMGESIAAIGNTLAVALAPAFTAVFESIAEVIGQGNLWFKGTTEGSNFVIGALGFVGKGFGIVADVIHTVKLAGQLLWATLTKGAAAFVGGIVWVEKGLQGLLNLIPGVHVTFADGLEEIVDDMHKFADDQFKGFNDALILDPPSVGINRFFDGLTAKAFEARDAAVKVKKDFAHLADIEAETEDKAKQDKGAKLFGAAMERGSQEARSAILAFQRGGDDRQTMRSVAQNTAQTVAALGQLVSVSQSTGAAIAAALRPVF